MGVIGGISVYSIMGKTNVGLNHPILRSAAYLGATYLTTKFSMEAFGAQPISLKKAKSVKK